MCLYVKYGQNMSVAKEDITVYKVMKKTNNEWFTPVMNYKVGSIIENETVIKKMQPDIENKLKEENEDEDELSSWEFLKHFIKK